MGFWDKVKDAVSNDSKKTSKEEITINDDPTSTPSPTDPSVWLTTDDTTETTADPDPVGEQASGPVAPAEDVTPGQRLEPKQDAQKEAKQDSPAGAPKAERQAAKKPVAKPAAKKARPHREEPHKLDREPEHRTYTVKTGDTLSEIGQRFGVSYMEIARLNDIKNPDLIYPGQVFKIPHK